MNTMNMLYVKLGIAGAVLTCALILMFYVQHLKDVIAKDAVTIIALNNSIKEQNIAVDNFKEASNKRLALAQDELRSAKKKADVVRTKAQIIYKTLPSSANDCASALELINEKR